MENSFPVMRSSHYMMSFMLLFFEWGLGMDQYMFGTYRNLNPYAENLSIFQQAIPKMNPQPTYISILLN